MEKPFIALYTAEQQCSHTGCLCFSYARLVHIYICIYMHNVKFYRNTSQQRRIFSCIWCQTILHVLFFLTSFSSFSTIVNANFTYYPYWRTQHNAIQFNYYYLLHFILFYISQYFIRMEFYESKYSCITSNVLNLVCIYAKKNLLRSKNEWNNWKFIILIERCENIHSKFWNYFSSISFISFAILLKCVCPLWLNLYLFIINQTKSVRNGMYGLASVWRLHKWAKCTHTQF